jgi:hypothetical protein
MSPRERLFDELSPRERLHEEERETKRGREELDVLSPWRVRREANTFVRRVHTAAYNSSC